MYKKIIKMKWFTFTADIFWQLDFNDLNDFPLKTYFSYEKLRDTRLFLFLFFKKNFSRYIQAITINYRRTLCAAYKNATI